MRRIISWDIGRRWFIGLCVAGLYGTMWFLTHVRGTTQIREAVLAAMVLAGDRSEFEDVTHSERPPKLGSKLYSCRAVAYGPLIVRVDYGWGAGPLTGGGGSALYIWLIGRSFQVCKLDEWSQ